MIAKARNMRSPQTRNHVPNQIIIQLEDGIEVFQSYDTVIAVRIGTQVALDVKSWNHSQTTAKYRSLFLGEDSATTKRKINDGVYTLVDLNT